MHWPSRPLRYHWPLRGQSTVPPWPLCHCAAVQLRRATQRRAEGRRARTCGGCPPKRPRKQMHAAAARARRRGKTDSIAPPRWCVQCAASLRVLTLASMCQPTLASCPIRSGSAPTDRSVSLFVRFSAPKSATPGLQRILTHERGKCADPSDSVAQRNRHRRECAALHSAACAVGTTASGGNDMADNRHTSSQLSQLLPRRGRPTRTIRRARRTRTTCGGSGCTDWQ
jgi:hypothetical protein